MKNKVGVKPSGKTTLKPHSHPPVSCAALTAADFKWGRTSRRGAADHQGNALMLPSAVACAEEVADFFGAGVRRVPLPSL